MASHHPRVAPELSEIQEAKPANDRPSGAPSRQRLIARRTSTKILREGDAVKQDGEVWKELNEMELVLGQKGFDELNAHNLFRYSACALAFKEPEMEHSFRQYQKKHARPRAIVLLLVMLTFLLARGSKIPFATTEYATVPLVFAELFRALSFLSVSLFIISLWMKNDKFYYVTLFLTAWTTCLLFFTAFCPGGVSFIYCRGLEWIEGKEVGAFMNSNSSSHNSSSAGYVNSGCDAEYDFLTEITSGFENLNNASIYRLAESRASTVALQNVQALLLVMFLNTNLINYSVICNVFAVAQAFFVSMSTIVVVMVRFPLQLGATIYAIPALGLVVCVVVIFLNERRIRHMFLLSSIKEQGMKAVMLARMEATKREEKSRFLATVSHETRTPIHGIIGVVDLLEEAGLGEEVTQSLSIVRECANNLLHIVNDLLDESKLAAKGLTLTPGPFDAVSLLHQVLKGLTLQCQDKGVELNLHISSTLRKLNSLRPLVGDKQRIGQVITNLISNAKKFTPSGKNIYVYATVAPLAESKEGRLRAATMKGSMKASDHSRQTSGALVKKHTVRRGSSGKYKEDSALPGTLLQQGSDRGHRYVKDVVGRYDEVKIQECQVEDFESLFLEPVVLKVSVQDEGIGIDPKDHQRVFVMYEQVHNKDNTEKVPGTGLGLGISQKLCGLMHGDIYLRSALGEGSTFTATMQLEWAQSSLASSLAEVESRTSSGARHDAVIIKPAVDAWKKRVLVISSNEYTKTVLVDYLASMHFNVVVQKVDSHSSAFKDMCEHGQPASIAESMVPVDEASDATLQFFVPGLSNSIKSILGGERGEIRVDNVHHLLGALPSVFPLVVVDVESFTTGKMHHHQVALKCLTGLLSLFERHKVECSLMDMSEKGSNADKPTAADFRVVLVARLSTSLRFLAQKFDFQVVRKPIVYNELYTAVHPREGTKSRPSTNHSSVHVSNGFEATVRKSFMQSADTREPLVLIADDDGVSRRLLKKMLQSLPALKGCNVMAFDDGDTLLEAIGVPVISQYSTGDLEAAEIKPSASIADVVLLVVDGHMERVGGVEVMKCLHEGDRSVDFPCIAASGAVSSEEMEAFQRAGFRHQLPKPFTKSLLQEALEISGFPSYLASWKASNQDEMSLSER
uniref:Histidine kinase n=1 Tax=Palpitomonas bilix TaxID=652834 RepID=A0A7S3DG15_9EUKA|mmetsp:Transcript_35353/g.91936  ORF Transcript_35353/g.91936 Transcript_35353/m.91936 type:complete len:1137 (+) Transcript_35353:363-3773(+)